MIVLSGQIFETGVSCENMEIWRVGDARANGGTMLDIHPHTHHTDDFNIRE